MKEEKINTEIQNTGAAKPVSNEDWETPEMSVISIDDTMNTLGSGGDFVGRS
nr:hypothetical protein [uncultured Draconibacterium sp.]